MKIAVMGTGTMACLFGSRMIQAGNEVWMVSGWKEQVEKIKADGIRLSDKEHEDAVLRPRVTMHAEDVIADGAAYPNLVLISCKGYQTERTVKNALVLIGTETRVLTLQNGMGNAEAIARFVPGERIYYGAASVAADAPALGHVKDNSNRNRSPLISITPFSPQEDPFFEKIGKLFTAMSYSTDISVAAEKFIWKKLCVNACGNTIAGIAQLENCVFSNDQDAFILINQICAEVCAVAQAKGVPLDCNETRAFIHATYYNQRHYLSTCQDMHNKRPTEVDSINGYIVREGRKLGIPTPVNETLLHLVRLISNHYADQWV